MTNPAHSPSPPRRLHFRLRTFLVLCVTLGATAGVVASQVIDVVHAYRHVKRLEQQGVVVTSNFNDRYGLYPWERRGTWRAILEWTVARPDEVNTGFARPSQVHEIVEQLTELPTVRRINLSAKDVSNDDLKHFTTLSSLEDLILSGTAIDDSALDSLTALPHLRTLDLSDTSISDAALAQIAKIGSLESVNLAKTNVSNRGLVDLRRTRPDLKVYPRNPRAFPKSTRLTLNRSRQSFKQTKSG